MTSRPYPATPLRVVAEAPETPAARAAKANAEAASHAAAHVEAMISTAEQLAGMMADAAAMNHVAGGIQNLARIEGPKLAGLARNMDSLRGRV